VIEVNVQPGNSGSPVLVGSDVAGVIESKSLSQASTAYAIPDAVVEADLAHAHTRAVPTLGCLPN
jgi:V8-like Glu-specific endopeptidase